jgi:hypothetical protein
VKANQKNLHRQIQHTTEQQKELETDLQHARSEVFHDLTGISQEWTGLKSLIKVERIGTRASMSISPALHTTLVA